MLTTKLVHCSGLAAILGGILWITTLAITATKPEHSRRGPEGFIVLLLVSLVLIATGIVGIYNRSRDNQQGMLWISDVD